MARLFLIDAYNAIYRLWPDVPEDRDRSRRMLVERTQAVLPRHQARTGGVGRVHLAFDTHAGAARTGLRSHSGRVSWLYVRGSADNAILEFVRRHEGESGGHRIVVVTDDRELAGRARQQGARTQRVDAFYGAPDPRFAAPSADETRAGGTPLGAGDFGLPEGPIDLGTWDEEEP
ncbi:MAG: NYN domain-containing protein [Planctomycetota bacterium]